MSFAPGTKLGPYEIVSALPSADGAEVYKATHAEDARTVAIRILPQEWAGSAEFSFLAERFDNQAKAVASLAHPHIGLLYEIGRQDEVDFLVTEYLEGVTLEARLQKGPLRLDQAMNVALAIGDALDKAHRAGLVHRALQPSNIMLTKEGAKLLDLGLKKIPSVRRARRPGSE